MQATQLELLPEDGWQLVKSAIDDANHNTRALSSKAAQSKEKGEL